MNEQVTRCKKRAKELHDVMLRRELSELELFEVQYIENTLEGEKQNLNLALEGAQEIEYSQLSHDQLALELSSIDKWSQKARYVHKWKKWLHWNGTRWEIDEQMYSHTLVRNYLRKKAEFISASGEMFGGEHEKLARREAKRLREAPTINAVEQIAKSNNDLVAAPDQFDSALDLLGSPGGTVDLTTGKLRSAEPNQYITKLTSIAPEAGNPELWLRFLNRACDGNQGLIDFLQIYCGYSLTGHTREHKLAFCYGTGRNGKSVFIDTVSKVLGDYAKTAPSSALLDSKNDKHPTDIAGLQGARFVAASELPPGKAWDESIIKTLTGGDKVTARKMRQDFFEFSPQFTLWIAGNHRPAFKGIDEALRARVLLIPFTVTIPEGERDPKLTEKLKAEWPQILNWMIEGAALWYQNGLQVPDIVTQASKEYLDSEDHVGEFISERCIELPGGFVTRKELYGAFKDWQEENGIRNPWTQTALSRAISERGFETGKTGKGRGFYGLQIKYALAIAYRVAKEVEI